jgi:D-lactate dehydrogenase (cytochrome)
MPCASTTPARHASEALRGVLRERFGAQFSEAMSVRGQHARGEAPMAPQAPDAVVFAQTNDDVVDLVRLCASERVPVIAHGAGSSLEGHLLAVQGGISVDLTQMNRILALDVEDLTVTVQAGVTREQLNEALKSTGLFFPIDPGAHATLGGMAATRASGTNAVRYGSMRDCVVNLTVVTAQGKLLCSARHARKSSAGYDLTRLFVGSEGTLGIITELTLRVYPVAESILAAVVRFPSARAAVDTVIQTIQLGVPIARSEYLCQDSIRAINAYSRTTLPEAPTLFLEFQGSQAAVREQVQTVQGLAEDNGGLNFEWALQPEERSSLWRARHQAYYACKVSRAGSEVVVTDTCVPISKLAASIEGARRILESATFPAMVFGHVGDGNFHALLVVDPSDAAELALAERLNEQIVALALSMNGTCTGEHGIGVHKMAFLEAELGADAVDLMRRVKQALDPDQILNPGKIFAQ